jgi:hypothetical protein
MEYDPWNIATPTQSTEDPKALQKKWWRTSSEMSSLPDGTPSTSPWWNETGLPSFGNHVSTDPGAWLGISMLKQALAGGPPLHVAGFGGNLTVHPTQLTETMLSTMKLRPVRLAYGSEGLRRVLYSSDNSMVSISFSNEGRYADVDVVSIDKEMFGKISKLCHGILTQDNPKEGFVYALAKGMTGYSLTRLGAAGTPLERDNYDAKVLAAYDHIVADLKAEAPCGRLIIMAGTPGCGKTYMVRSLLTDIPKAAFVVVPPHLVSELGSPELLPALAGARQDGLTGPMALIIEDADKVLVNRQAGDMAAISSLLNLGDGILGSVLDVRIIATTNAEKLEMDAATRRKGRLCQYIDVGSVEPDRAESILRRLTGTSKRPTNPVPLGDIYSYARDLGWTPPPKVKPASPWEKAYIL